MTKTERIAIYTKLCEQGKIKALFMQPWWLDTTGAWDVCLAVRNEQVVGAMPYALITKWGLMTKIGMPAQTHHLQLWMDRPPDISDHKWLTREKQIIWLLLDSLPAYDFFSMVFEASSFDNWLPFHWKGFRQEMRYTFVIERTSYESEDYQISRNLRRNLKSAETEIRIDRRVDIEPFYQVCQETYRRQKKQVPYRLSLLKKMDEAAASHGAGIRLGAYNLQNNLVAVSWLLWDKERAYYFIAGDTDSGRSTSASILLCQEAIRLAFEEQQVLKFDFCGSMIEPVTDMRRQFGAKAEGLMKIYRSKWKIWELAYNLSR